MRAAISLSLAACVTVFASCAAHPAPPQFQSGTRLRAMYLDGGGGAKLFTGWYDSQLGVPCGFAMARDGTVRCLPGPSTYYYTDSACTEPVWYEASCVAVPQYVQAESSGGTCGEGAFNAVFGIGNPATTLPVGFGHLNGTCNGFAAAPGAQFLGVGPEIDPSTFVGATEKIVSFDDGALAVRERVADDGSSQILDIVDGHTQSACTLFDVGAPIDPAYVNRCVANVSNALAVDSDSTCTTPASAATILSDTCNAPTTSDVAIVYSEPTPGSCNQTLMAVESLGPTLDPSSFFEGVPTTCNPVQSDSVVRSVGAAVPADQFVHVEVGNLGSGRLRVRSVMDREGNALQPSNGLFFDAQLQTSCVPIVFADATRCVPSSVGYISGDGPFADAQCTQRLIAQPSTPSSCSTPPDVFLLGGDACSTAYTAYGLASVVVPTELYSLGSSGCNGVTPDGASSYFRTVPVDDTIWPPLTPTTD